MVKLELLSFGSKKLKTNLWSFAGTCCQGSLACKGWSKLAPSRVVNGMKIWYLQVVNLSQPLGHSLGDFTRILLLIFTNYKLDQVFSEHSAEYLLSVSLDSKIFICSFALPSAELLQLKVQSYLLELVNTWTSLKFLMLNHLSAVF